MPIVVDLADAAYELLDGEAEIRPGLRIVPTPGHTDARPVRSEPMSAGTEQRPERRFEIEEERGEDGRHVLYYRWPAETKAEEADGGANRQDAHDPAERSPTADADV